MLDLLSNVNMSKGDKDTMDKFIFLASIKSVVLYYDVFGRVSNGTKTQWTRYFFLQSNTSVRLCYYNIVA